MQDMLFFDDDPYNIQDRGLTGCQHDQKPGDVMMFVGWTDWLIDPQKSTKTYCIKIRTFGSLMISFFGGESFRVNLWGSVVNPHFFWAEAHFFGGLFS